MKTILFSFSLLTGVALADKIPFYIGTGSEEGVFKSLLDTETGELSKPEVLGPKKKFLYTFSTNQTGKSKKSWNTAHSFRIEEDFSLSSVGVNKTGSSGALHLTIHPDGEKLFIAHYGKAEISSLQVLKDGILTPPVSVT